MATNRRTSLQAEGGSDVPPGMTRGPGAGSGKGNESGAAEQLEIAEQRRFQELAELKLVELQAIKEELARRNEELEASRAELEQERARYEDLFEGAPDAYFVTDWRSHIEKVNLAGCRLLRQRREFLLRLPLVHFVRAKDKRKIRELLSRLRHGAAAVAESLELALRGPKQEAITCLLTVKAVREGTGEKVSGLRWLVRDISERKRTEAASRESVGNYRSLFNSIDDGFCIIEVLFGADGKANDYRFLEVNPAFERHTGLAGAPGKRVREMAPNQEAHWFETCGRVALTGQPERFAASGEAPGRFYEAYAFRVGEPEERKVAVLFRDETKRKRAEEALHKTEEQFRRAIEDAPIPVIMHAEDGEVLQISRTWTELTGYTRADVPTLDAWLTRAYGEGADAVRHHVQELFKETRRTIGMEFPVRTADGRTRHWSFSASSPGTLRDGRRFVVGMAVDITEKKHAEAVLERGKEELEKLVAERTAKLQELVGELEHFSYTITHDLKSPLRAMRGFAEAANQMSGEGQARPFLERISTAAERMDRLIADALNYSQAVRQELPLEDVDTGALLRGIVDSYPEFQPSKAGIRVEGQLPVVLGNEAGLTQCFSNLLGNAVKFVRPGQGPEIRVWAEPVPSAEDGMQNKESHLTPAPLPQQRGESGWVRIWVEDKGIGIPRELLPRVFDMFSRASKAYEGTGIGLALVRKVVQRMGGRVGVESEEGTGSRFWMDLKSGAERPSREQAAVRSLEPKSGAVLYVEDEESDRMFMEMAVEEKGMASSLRVVGDGRAAIEYLSGAGKYGDRKEYPLPAVVLLDLNLPVVSGFEVLRWTRNHPDFARTPVVVFSSSTREDDQVRARELGANAFVAKPSSGLRFGEVVEELRERWMEKGKLKAEG